ncbi:hypothetical protein [Microcystis aeruginosa]|uniref:hypothetical protein n=1 Tax=Microcystis aeruginosa TaxID=1126 RepID=UPI0018823ACE|nr:hypothetical protein [Microcystis aeruginosa]MBE8994311.1 hypothetical protein [Microcystis aeruginosa LEGE 91341]
MKYQQLLFNDSNNYWFSFATIVGLKPIIVGLTLQYLLVDILTVSDYIMDTIREDGAIVKNSTKKLDQVLAHCPA